MELLYHRECSTKLPFDPVSALLSTQTTLYSTLPCLCHCLLDQNSTSARPEMKPARCDEYLICTVLPYQWSSQKLLRVADCNTILSTPVLIQCYCLSRQHAPGYAYFILQICQLKNHHIQESNKYYVDHYWKYIMMACSVVNTCVILH